MDSKETEIIRARLLEAALQCQERNALKFVGFLDTAAAAIAKATAEHEGIKYMLFGGYNGAERSYFGAFPDWCEPSEQRFPIVALRIINKSDKKLTHRDFLGAITALGIERDTVGDILVGHPDTVVFVSQTVADYIIAELKKIGSCGVEVAKETREIIFKSNSFEAGSFTVASSRLDCVVAALCRCSRTKACELVDAGLVAVDGVEVTKVTKEIIEGNIISVRKYGKFIVDGITDLTKKQRLVLKYRKYI